MGTIVRKNERSWAIELITEINLMLNRLNLKIKRAGGESTLSINKKSMFPDVLLYADDNQTKILQGWELKMPDVLITDEEYIKDATRKARALNLDSFFIWNFTYGKLYIKDNGNDYSEAKVWTGTSHIKTRDDVTRYKDDWIPIIKEVILSINDYFVNGVINSAPLVDVLADDLLTTIVDRNKNIVAENYEYQIISNMKMEQRFREWWRVYQQEYKEDENNMYTAYSKNVLLNWTNRLLFANMIKKYHNCAKKIDLIDASVTPQQGNKIINEIVMEGDFYNVFKALEYNDVIPNETWIDLVDFNQFIVNSGVIDINQEVLHDVLEKTVNTSKREIRGQFATPGWLADLLTQITVFDWKTHVADTCSGTGTIAKAIMKNKLRRLGDIEETLSTTWISDKYAYPLHISNIALTSAEGINIPLNMFQSDLFTLESGKIVEIRDPKNGSKIKIEYPSLGAVVSNLPFIEYNGISSDEEEFITKYNQTIYRNTGIEFKTGKADFYMYIPFKLHELLCENGRLGIILSNSWLGTEAGNKFFNALCYYYDLQTVILSDCGRWFENADVVATLVVMQKKSISSPDENNKISFCLTEKDISSLSEDEYGYLITSVVLQEELYPEYIRMKQYSLSEIRSIQPRGISLNALFHDISWMSEMQDALIPIKNLFYVKRGERRGWNDLFYPCTGNGIEKEYIKPVLKRPSSLTSYIADTDTEAFCCHRTKEELSTLQHTGALRWIEKFERITNGSGKLLPNALKRPGYLWYEMNDETKAELVTALNPNKRLFVAKFSEPTFVDQRFTRLIRREKENDINLLHALLNSIYGMFAIESVGFGRGLGVLDASSTNFSKIYMIDPSLISVDDANEIMELFNKFRNRPVKDTEDELESPERIVFDKKVLKTIGKEHLYEKIKKSLLSMQKTRLTVR